MPTHINNLKQNENFGRLQRVYDMYMIETSVTTLFTHHTLKVFSLHDDVEIEFGFYFFSGFSSMNIHNLQGS